MTSDAADPRDDRDAMEWLDMMVDPVTTVVVPPAVDCCCSCGCGCGCLDAGSGLFV